MLVLLALLSMPCRTLNTKPNRDACCARCPGHSLGGALATLAAFEIKQKWPDAQMFVYTFGAPRVGNTAWASEYDALVPGSWYIVNHQVRPSWQGKLSAAQLAGQALCNPASKTGFLQPC